MEIAPTTLEGVNERVTELDATVRQRMDEFEIRFEEAQDDRALLRARVNTLFKDRPDHRRTAMLMDKEAMYTREAWAFSMDRSSAIAAHVRTLETQVVALIAQTSSLQTQLTTTLERIEILEARDPEPQEGPAEAGSSWTFVYLLAIIKMAPKKRTKRAAPATTTTPTTTITNAQLQALNDRGIAVALLERDADMSRNGDNNNDSGTGGRRQMTTPRECTYTDFLNCQPMSFQGTEGVVGLTQWLEKMESVFQITNCTVACQVKFASCTLQGSALTMFPKESAKVERYISGLPKMIHGSVKASKPQSMQEAIEFATKMMDKKMLTHAELRDCKGRPAATNNNNPNNNNQRAQGENVRGIACFECRVQGHYKSDCPKLKNDHGYDVELVDEMGSFDVIIGMDWLVKYHAVIVYDEKLVRVPFGDEILIFHGDGSNNGHESRLNIISCTKTQRYLLKGCLIFLAHVTTKEAEDKSKEKRLEDVPIVQDFPEDLPGFPLVKNKREKDKIGTKSDKKREAWRSPEKSREVSVNKARKTEENAS
uniref:Reverse transcriptase domain-containing protein n=1 Tax=Tanacetum cinerariifolium TaxID=118510 RepID=A0A699J5W6_TANCI|nr:reverse transcriptase domain-containing protein [Tanacetum cinerariifolium]